jgi:hypothetical protein
LQKSAPDGIAGNQYKKSRIDCKRRGWYIWLAVRGSSGQATACNHTKKDERLRRHGRAFHLIISCCNTELLANLLNYLFFFLFFATFFFFVAFFFFAAFFLFFAIILSPPFD